MMVSSPSARVSSVRVNPDRDRAVEETVLAGIVTVSAGVGAVKSVPPAVAVPAAKERVTVVAPITELVAPVKLAVIWASPALPSSSEAFVSPKDRAICESSSSMPRVISVTFNV